MTNPHTAIPHPHGWEYRGVVIESPDEKGLYWFHLDGHPSVSQPSLKDVKSYLDHHFGN